MDCKYQHTSRAGLYLLVFITLWIVCDNQSKITKLDSKVSMLLNDTPAGQLSNDINELKGIIESQTEIIEKQTKTIDSLLEKMK